MTSEYTMKIIAKDEDTSELYHHGILGQRWGKKNGPPYPLGADDHSASEKKSGWRKSLKSWSDNHKKKKAKRKKAEAAERKREAAFREKEKRKEAAFEREERAKRNEEKRKLKAQKNDYKRQLKEKREAEEQRAKLEAVRPERQEKSDPMSEHEKKELERITSKKNVRDMSESEISEMTKRLKAENDYAAELDKYNARIAAQKEAGKSKIKKAISKYGQKAAESFIENAIDKGTKALVAHAIKSYGGDEIFKAMYPKK